MVNRKSCVTIVDLGTVRDRHALHVVPRFGRTRYDQLVMPPPGPGQARPMRGTSGGFGGGNAPKASADAAQSVNVVTGAEAVQMSKRQREQKEVTRVDDMDSPSSVRRIAGKTFYLRDGVWIDSELKPDAKLQETTLTFGSDAYFELLKQKPKLADYFSLGERVVVVFEGRVYRVNAAAP